ncbi:MAG: L-threonylcarbamoyladenylate synthase [Patescibacteria group bacterium UBA2163]
MQFGPTTIVLYPTDTLYGLGVDATSPEAITRLQHLKGRDDKKPISIVVSDIAMMNQYVEVTPLARKLAEKFLPGKITLVLKAKTRPENRDDTPLASGVVSQEGTVGIRIPDRPEALELVRDLGRPLTATSANVSGKATARTPEKILLQFNEKASMITDVVSIGKLPISEPSTVIDARGEKPIILREGAILTATINAAVL